MRRGDFECGGSAGLSRVQTHARIFSFLMKQKEKGMKPGCSYPFRVLSLPDYIRYELYVLHTLSIFQ